MLIVDHPSRIGQLAESQTPESSTSILAYMAGLEKSYAILVLASENIETVRIAELKTRFLRCYPLQCLQHAAHLPFLGLQSPALFEGLESF